MKDTPVMANQMLSVGSDHPGLGDSARSREDPSIRQGEALQRPRPAFLGRLGSSPLSARRLGQRGLDRERRRGYISVTFGRFAKRSAAIAKLMTKVMKFQY